MRRVEGHRFGEKAHSILWASDSHIDGIVARIRGGGGAKRDPVGEAEAGFSLPGSSGGKELANSQEQ